MILQAVTCRGEKVTRFSLNAEIWRHRETVRRHTGARNYYFPPHPAAQAQEGRRRP
jgi:hypothetical protein